jgi:hypothetical protein
VRKQTKLDLDALLFPATPPAWADVVEFFRDGEFCDEPYLVQAIEKYLLTEEQRKLMFDHKLSIEKMLNGRVEGEEAQKAEEAIYAEWNAKLGFPHCGCY